VWDPWDKQNSLAWILALIINSADLMGRHPAPVHTKEKVVGREMARLVLLPSLTSKLMMDAATGITYRMNFQQLLCCGDLPKNKSSQKPNGVIYLLSSLQ
jgi:hypothetical protein